MLFACVFFSDGVFSGSRVSCSSLFLTVVGEMTGRRRQGFTGTDMHMQPVQLCREEDRRGFRSTDREDV